MKLRARLRSIPFYLFFFLGLTSHAQFPPPWQNSKIRIEGLKSLIPVGDQRLKVEAQWAELSPALNQQRIYQANFEIETDNLLIKGTAQQGLFRDQELLVQGQVRIQFQPNPKPRTRPSYSPLLLVTAESDPIVFDFLSKVMRGSRAAINDAHGSFEGQGFRLDWQQKKMIWVGALKNRTTQKTLRVPYRHSILNSSRLKSSQPLNTDH